MLFSVGGCRTSASGKGSHDRRRRRVRIHAKHSYLRSLFFSFSTLDFFLTASQRAGLVFVGYVEYQMFDFLFFEFFPSVVFG